MAKKSFMKPNIRILVITVACMCPVSAFSLDCKNAANTLDINECASIEQKNVESRLNSAYQKAVSEMGQLDAKIDNSYEIKKDFINAQRAWIKFRDLDCKAIYTRWSSGTVRTLKYIACMQSHAEQRIRELESYSEF